MFQRFSLKILVYTNKINNRIQYTFKTVFQDFIGVELTVTSDKEMFLSHKGIKINYSKEKIVNSFHVYPHEILFEGGIKDYPIQIVSHHQYKKTFFCTSKGKLPFDMFAATFWLISRYEEYLPFKANKYNVFNFRASIAWQNDFISLPIINQWLCVFKQELVKWNNEIVFPKIKSSIALTFDIDSVYKYKYKGLGRSLLGLLADLSKFDFKNISNRFQTLFLGKKDEYDCYDFLIEQFKKIDSKPIVFYLLGDYGLNDKNHPSNSKQFRELIKHLSDYSHTGIHPSFGSNYKKDQLGKEIIRLREIVHKEVVLSRQHFGMLQFPNTYQKIVNLGITDDYSMGFPQFNGYRAGTSFVYKWFDLSKNLQTELRIHPYAINDEAFGKETNYNLEEMHNKFQRYLHDTLELGGELQIVFRSNSFSNNPKNKVYKDFLSYLVGEAQQISMR